MSKTYQKKIIHYVLDLLKILLGTMITSVSFVYLTYPNSIVSGGITGIAQILNLLLETPVGVMVFVMNIPLFLLAWKKMGRVFVVMSLIAMTSGSLLIDLLSQYPYTVTTDPLLGAVYGGLLNGFGSGLIYSTGATAGGTDIPARMLRRKYPYINFGTISLSINAVIIVAFAVIFKKFESCMYTVICMFVGSKVVDLVAYGAINSRLCFIVSAKSREIEEAISTHLVRGVTFLHGEGAWSGEEREVIMCAVKRQQIADLRKIVKIIDPSAFSVITDARSVYGSGFDRIDKED